MQLRYKNVAPEKEILQIFNETIKELINDDNKVVYLDADLMGSLKTAQLWKEYPNNVFNTGIQEANMVGVAAGLNLEGFKPYIHSFSPFATRRVFDQVFLSVGYAQKSVRIIGSDAGIMATKNGGTHMCFEDVALMRTIPNALVLEATDGVMFKSFLQLSKDRPGVTYIRTARRGLPDIYMPNEKFAIGKGKVLHEGSDISLIAEGIMVATCLDAANELEKEGISARVVDIITIKPIDEDLILDCAQKTKGIISVENASIIGGLGGAICETLSNKYPTTVSRIGVNDCYGCVGDEKFLRQKYGLTKENIIQRVKQVINKAR